MVKSAASKFVSGLGNRHLVSVIEFDTNVELQMAATPEHAAAGAAIKSITVEASHNGACIWDVFYAGMQQSMLVPSALDSGNLIILLTDVAPGDNVGWNCGIRLMDDFLDLTWNLPVPVFSIYVGDDFAQSELVSWMVGQGAVQTVKDEKEIYSTLLTMSGAAGLEMDTELRPPAPTTDASHEAMVFVPPGEFIMGENTVYLDPFWIDKTEVTNTCMPSACRRVHATRLIRTDRIRAILTMGIPTLTTTQ